MLGAELSGKVEITVLADRGFGDQELHEHLAVLGWGVRHPFFARASSLRPALDQAGMTRVAKEDLGVSRCVGGAHITRGPGWLGREGTEPRARQPLQRAGAVSALSSRSAMSRRCRLSGGRISCPGTEMAIHSSGIGVPD